MWGSRGFERVLCRVIDQDLCVDLLADLARKSLGLVVLIFSLGTHIGFGQLGDKLMPIRKCGFLGLPGADYRLKYTWMMTGCNDTILSRRGSPTREVTIHPEETTFPFLNSPSGYHDKLKAHFFEPLYAIQSVWDREGIIDSSRLVIFPHLALGQKGESVQSR